MPCTQWRNNKITNLVPSKYIIRNSFSINYEAIKDVPDIYTIQQHILWHIKQFSPAPTVTVLQQYSVRKLRLNRASEFSYTYMHAHIECIQKTMFHGKLRVFL